MSGDVPPSRSLSQGRRDAIFDATLGLVVEIGYDRTTMDAIAARAGVGKATLYRWWSGKPDLTVDALHQRSHHERAVPDTGSLRGDLVWLVRDLVALVRSEAAVLLGIGAAMRGNHELAAASRDRLRAGERERLCELVARAAGRGERSPAAAVPGLAHEIAPSLVFGRLLFTGEPLDEDFVAAVVDEALLPMLAHTSGGRS